MTESFVNPFKEVDFRESAPVEPIDNNYNTVDMFVDGFKASAYGIGKINHPSGTRVDPEFKLANQTEILDTLEPEVVDSVIGYNPGNEEEFFASIARASDEVNWQKDIYEYGGLTGSIAANLVGGIVQPDMLLLGPYAAASKAVKAANTSIKLSSMFRNSKAASAVATGTEFAAVGTGLEALRQESSGVSFEDDLYNVAMFGMVLGAGGKAASNLLASGPTPRIVQAMDKDIEETKSFLLRPNDAGPMMMKGDIKWSDKIVTLEDVKDLPTTGFYGKLNVASPRGRLYNIQSPKLRRMVSWLAPSKLPLTTQDGRPVVQGIRSAEDIINTTYKGMYNDVRAATREVYSNYKKTTPEALNEYEFGRAVYKQRIEAGKALREFEVEKQLLEAKIEDVQTQLDGLRKDKAKDNTQEIVALEKQELDFVTTYDNFKTSTKPEYTIDDAFIKQADDAITTYYGKMNGKHQYWNKGLDESEINVEGSKFYTTRLWNKQAISNKPASEVVASISKAIINSPTAKVLARTDKDAYKEYIDSAPQIADNMVSKIYDTQSLNELMDLVPRKGGKDLTTSKYSIARRIDVDENMLDDLIQDNIDDVLELYHRDSAGRLSLKESLGFGTKAELAEEVKDITKELRDLGYNPKQVKKITDDLDVVIDSILGVRSIANNPDSTGQTIKRFSTKWNNITLGMGFGYTSLLEIGPVVALTGVKGLKYFAPAVNNTIRKYRGKESDIAIYNQLKAMGIGMDVYNSRVASRFSDEGINFAHGAAERITDKAQSSVMHGSGLVAVTDSYKDMAGMAYIHNLHELGRRLAQGENLQDIVSKTDLSRFARHGLTAEDIKMIGSQDVKYQNNNTLEDLNWDNWDINLKDKLAVAVNRAVVGNILEPTSLDLPSKMSDPNGIFVPLLLQYMRFPIAATESYLLRGLAEKDKGAVLGAILSTAVLGTLEIGKDTLLKTSGISSELMYDLDTEEGQSKLAWKLFNYNPYSGITPTIANIGFGIAGQPQPGTTYVPKDLLDVVAGPTYSRAKGLLNIIPNQIEEPGVLGKSEMYQLKINTPFVGSLPIVKDWWSNYIKENY